MREKLETLPLVELREIAKQQGIKYVMKYKKSELIEEMLRLHEEGGKVEQSSSVQNIEQTSEPVDVPQNAERMREDVDDEKFSSIDNEKATKENICELIKKFNFDTSKVKLEHIRYITGGWFEEFVYQKICNEYENVEKENIALNVNISKGNDKNELDVIYLDKNNMLHIIECKSFLDGKDGSKILTEALYKLQAIIKTKFGLFVKHHLYTKSIIDKETPLNRAREFGIDLKDGKDF
jgi:hypothetical protein